MRCCVCGGERFGDTKVLWPKLIADWGLSAAEVDYVDRQQGTQCLDCGSNLRSIVLAEAILGWAGAGVPLQRWIEGYLAKRLAVLEINEAGTLSPLLRGLPQHVLAEYPTVDIHALPYAEGSFDLVVHSDTLEHVPDPVKGLAECRRVLRVGGALCFTVPIIVGRMTRGRAGLPLSYHGQESTVSPDWAVQTEFGADAWTWVIEAGFSAVSIHTLDYPSAIAMLARK